VSLNSRRWLHAFFLLMAAAFAWPGTARAACDGVIVTANTTKFWAKVTVLDPSQSVSLGSGFLAPHSAKAWSGGAASVLCGFPVFFQYEVTSATGTTAPATVGKAIANIASGALMVLPANVLIADLWQVPQTVGGTFWLGMSDKQAVTGAIKGPLNAISCLKTADNTYFSADDSTYCSRPPVTGPTGGSSMPTTAGCGTVVTLNQTDHWVWVTIYSLGRAFKYDWGWVAPHNFRAWHAGGASTPMSYMCGSFYEVRYEIKRPRNSATPTDGPNLFDTAMQINPQLSLSDALELLHSVGDLLECVTPEAEGLCAAQWGLQEGAQSAIFGMVGKEAEGSVVCAKSSDDTNFWLENTSNCANPPATGSLPQPGKPAPPVYAFSPPGRTVGVGAAPTWRFNVTLNGNLITDQATYNKCAFVSDRPGIAKFDDPHIGRIHGLKPGSVRAHWQCNGKTYASGTIVVK
jgi:hypothetical protein